MSTVSKLIKWFQRNFETRVPRETRICLRYSDLFFYMDSGGEPISVSNISYSGMALDNSAGNLSFNEGDILRGTLKLETEQLHVSFKVLHREHGLVGGQFEELPHHFRQNLRDFYHLEFSAHKLISIQSNMLKQDVAGTPYYYYGDKGNELYYVLDSGKVSFVSVIFEANFISYGENMPCRTGRVIMEPEETTAGYRKVDNVEWKREYNDELVDDAIKFLENVERLSDNHKQVLEELLTELYQDKKRA